jgi:hypothetical protein
LTYPLDELGKHFFDPEEIEEFERGRFTDAALDAIDDLKLK